uniref:Leukocyte cell derived chemotaxin 2, tandem duplicate 1 n=1 Tax=Myripristis murdjan TaxID=586833 RepID=A0A667YWL1_9TELE
MYVCVCVCVCVSMLGVCDGVTFGQLCSGNPTNRIRGSDKWGVGHHGARRTGHTHNGVDIVCQDGATVYAPFDLTIERRARPYTDPKKAAINNGILARGQGVCFKLFYVAPVKVSGSVAAGQRLGVLLPMQQVYPGITSHLHLELCDQSDPTPYL